MRSPRLPRRLDTAVSGKPKTSNIAPWNPKTFRKVYWLNFEQSCSAQAEQKPMWGPVSPAASLARALTRHRRVIHSPRAASLPHMFSAYICFALGREQAPALQDTAFLPSENPAVFAVLFEAAKAKYALCNSRVRLSKKCDSIFCV